MSVMKEQKRKLKMKKLVREFIEKQRQNRRQQDALLAAGRIDIGIVK